MKIVINIVLVLVIIFLALALKNSIAEPIEFQNEYAKREKAVANQLKKIRKCQIAFKDVVGDYAPDFDTLTEVLKNDTFKIVSVIGDADANLENNTISYDTTFVRCIDSIVGTLKINLDSLRYIPFSGGQEFEIQTGVAEYQGTRIPVLEVKCRKSTYMGKYADPQYQRYDDKYNPKSFTKFGDMSRPSTSGNWRKSI